MLLVETVAGVQRVVRCCERSAEAGVRGGMVLAHARALLTGPSEALSGGSSGRASMRSARSARLIIEPYDAVRDARALGALASWALRFSPIVSVDPPDGLLLDIDGCQRVFHGEHRLVDRMAGAVGRLGLRARIATADTYGCAWAVARYGPSERTLVVGGDERGALDPLPVEALRLDEDAVDALHEVNVRRVGELAALPREALPARFGRGLVRRMDQALGAAMEAIEPIRPRVHPRVERTFDGPLTQLEGIMRTVQDLVVELAGILERGESGARAIELAVDRLDAPPLRETITLSRPSRRVRHLWSLLAPRVERLHMGMGVERIVLRAVRTGRLRHGQSARWRAGRVDDTRRAEARPGEALGELLDTLTDRLGRDRAFAVEPAASHVPEQAFRAVSRLPGEDRTTIGGTPGAPPAVTHGSRPSMLYARPEPVEVVALLPDGPPSLVRRHGIAHRVRHAIGPERIAAPWWSTARGDAARDYFRVQDEAGRWLWMYRDIERGTWFVHGEWG